MSIFNGVWSTLKFNAGDALGSAASNFRLRYKNMEHGSLVYRNNRAYKSVLVHIAKMKVQSELHDFLSNLWPRMQRRIENEIRKGYIEQQKLNTIKLIEKREKQNAPYGMLTTKEGNTVYAKNKYGERVSESLIVSYDGEGQYDVEDVTTIQHNKDWLGNAESSTQYATKFKTVTRFYIDLLPKVTLSSQKNVVQTQVQGRDYSRKELVSGGDLEFTVNGSICSNEDGIYPSTQVRQFINIMQYNGIVNVNHMIFDQFNVKRVIIKSYSLGDQEFKNIQPYTFSCVAVEPDEDVMVKKDTIALMNDTLKKSPLENWYRVLLGSKLNQILINKTMETVTGLAEQGIGMGLDAATGWNEPSND